MTFSADRHCSRPRHRDDTVPCWNSQWKFFARGWTYSDQPCWLVSHGLLSSISSLLTNSRRFRCAVDDRSDCLRKVRAARKIPRTSDRTINDKRRVDLTWGAAFRAPSSTTLSLLHLTFRAESGVLASPVIDTGRFTDTRERDRDAPPGKSSRPCAPSVAIVWLKGKARNKLWASFNRENRSRCSPSSRLILVHQVQIRQRRAVERFPIFTTFWRYVYRTCHKFSWLPRARRRFRNYRIRSGLITFSRVCR